MAKESAPAVIKDVAAPTTPPVPRPQPLAPSKPQASDAVKVINWGNGEELPAGQSHQDSPPVDDGGDFVEEGDGQTEGGDVIGLDDPELDEVLHRPGKTIDTGEEAEEEPPAAAAQAEPEETPAEKRSAILARIAAEKKVRDTETQLARSSTRIQELEHQLAGFGTGTLGQRLAKLGITTEEQRQELAEAILLGKDEIKFAAPALPTAEERVAILEKQIQDEKQAAVQSAQRDSYIRGVQATAAKMAEMDAPYTAFIAAREGMVRDGKPVGYARVMARAGEIWRAAGADPAKAGEALTVAAKEVEAEYRKELQPLGVTFATKAPAKASATPAVPVKQPPRVGTGSQTRGARSPIRKDLPLDPAERDAIIRREMGWAR